MEDLKNKLNSICKNQSFQTTWTLKNLIKYFIMFSRNDWLS